MKNIFKFAVAIAIAATSFASCNRTEIDNPQNEDDFYYTFILGDPATRSILSSDENGKFGAWEDGDRLGTSIDEAKPGYAYVTIATPTTFKIYKKGGLAGGERVYAYYPYNASATSVTEIPFEIPASQNQNGASFDFDAMPMVAEEFVVPASYASTEDNTPIGEISLVNLGSVIDFQVYSSNETYAAETILSVMLEAATPVVGSFSKDITAVKFNTESTLAISGFTGSEVLTTVANAPAIGADRANAAHVYMVVAPTTGVTGSVIVKTNKAEYTYSLSTAQTFKRAGLKSYGLNLGTCQNRVAEEIKTATFVFNTVEGVKALDINVPAANSQLTEVPRAQSNAIVLTGDLGTNSSNIPRVYNSNGNLNFRVMKGNTLSFAVTEGGTIKSIVFDAGTNFNLTVEDDGLSGTTWNGSASIVAFTNTDAERTDIKTITVSYTGGVEPTTLEMSDITCTDSEQNETSLTFTWTAVANASGYRVSVDNGETYGDAQAATSFTWTNLDPNSEFTIYVKAISTNALYLNSAPKSQKGKTKEATSTGVEWIKTAITALTTGDVIAIVDETSSRAMSNNGGTTTAPSATQVNLSSDKSKLNVAPDAELQWVVTVSNGTYSFNVANTDNYLYCINNNNGLRVGAGENNTFVFESNLLKNVGQTRYIGVYNNSDWRSYTTIHNNIKNTVTSFYKKVGNEPAPTTYSVSIASDIQNGSVNASKTSGIEAGESITLTASPTDAANWEFDSWSITGITLTEAQKTTNPLTIQMPESDLVVSASFKEKEHNGDEQTAMFIFNTDAGLSALGIAKPATGASTELGDDTYTVNGVSLSATDGGTATRVYNSQGNTDLRIYKNGGSLTFSVDNSKNITSIVMTGGTTNKFTANVGTFSNGTWEGSASSVTLTATDTGKIDTITVTYE